MNQAPNLIATNDIVERYKVMLSDHAQRVATEYRQAPISPKIVSGLTKCIAALLIVGSGLATYAQHINLLSGVDIVGSAELFTISALSMALIGVCGGYNLHAYARPKHKIVTILALWTFVFAIPLALPPQSGMPTNHWLQDWYLSGLLLLAGFHALLAGLITRWTRAGRLQRRAIIVGGGDDAAELIRSISRGLDNTRICGIFDDRSGERSPDHVLGYQRLGTFAELVEFGRKAQIDMLLISVPLTAEARLLQILHQLWELPVEIRISAQNYKLRFQSRSYSYIGAARFFDVFDKPIADWDAVAKRGFDLLFATLALALVSPVLIATAIAIKLDSKGPVFFRQKRYGFNNQIIDVLKFRSMYVDQCDHHAKVAVTKVDPRVTKVGRIIRKTSIDELPQLLNVLLGRLSLVGPRPHAIGSNTQDHLWESIVDSYFVRHKVKPGVTGWAQINGWRGEVDTPDKLRSRVEHDLYYIENWNLLLDFYILARTPLALFNTHNAY